MNKKRPEELRHIRQLCVEEIKRIDLYEMVTPENKVIKDIAYEGVDTIRRALHEATKE